MLQRIVFSFVIALGVGSALAAAPATPTPAQTIGVRVNVDAAGKVTSATPSNAAAIPALNQAAVEIAGKLAFDPATKNGVAVASETSLFLTLALEPKDNGQFGIRLKKAISGPDRSKSAPVIAPKYQQRDAKALVVMKVDLRADGSVDPDSIQVETMELKVKSSFAEARYVDAISASLRESRFILDKVAGSEIPARLTLPYQFGGGAGDRRGERKSSEAMPVAAQGGVDVSKADEKRPPEMKVESLVAGVTLPKVRFTAPTEK